MKLDDLYQEVILDHNRRPRNYGRLEDATSFAHGHNPLCGDDFHLYLLVDASGKIQKISFEGSGCAISKSSASLMTTQVQGKSVQEAENFKESFIHLLTDETVPLETREAVGGLKFFEGVKNFPARVKCATLIWRTLEEALKGNANQEAEVSTEKT